MSAAGLDAMTERSVMKVSAEMYWEKGKAMSTYAILWMQTKVMFFQKR